MHYQSYDRAANISSSCNGENSLILEKTKLAHYTHCGAYRINVIAKDIANN